MTFRIFVLAASLCLSTSAAGSVTAQTPQRHDTCGEIKCDKPDDAECMRRAEERRQRCLAGISPPQDSTSRSTGPVSTNSGRPNSSAAGSQGSNAANALGDLSAAIDDMRSDARDAVRDDYRDWAASLPPANTSLCGSPGNTPADDYGRGAVYHQETADHYRSQADDRCSKGYRDSCRNARSQYEEAAARAAESNCLYRKAVERDRAAAHAAPAPRAALPSRSASSGFDAYTSTIGEILDDARATAALKKVMPELSSPDVISFLEEMREKTLAQLSVEFGGGEINEDLDRLNAEFKLINANPN